MRPYYKKVSKTAKKWVLSLTKFEKLLLILSFLPIIFAILSSVLILSGIFLLDLAGKQRYEAEAKRAQQELLALEPQISLSKTQEVQVKLSSEEIKQLPEYQDCIKKKRPNGSRLTVDVYDYLCASELRNKQKVVTKQLNLVCNSYESTENTRLPKTDQEKQYCVLKNKLRGNYSSVSESVDLNKFINLSALTSTSFLGLFLISQFLKYSVRAALNK